MVFVPADRYLWDFWFAPRRGQDDPYHLFFLQAPRSLRDPEERHGRATVGHAVSRDLVSWEERPTALEAGPAGAWDDRAIWTGSMIRHDGTCHWFYTGINQRDRIQRIGLATATDPDLAEWRRHPSNPLLEADPRWYEKHVDDPTRWPSEACRDPFVIHSAEDDVFYMFYTARAAGGSAAGAEIAAAPERPMRPADGCGVVGCARSRDLTTWEALPPVTAPGDFGDLEVPQVLHLNGRYYLLFCTAKHSAQRLAQTGPTGQWYGTHYLIADRLIGPYRLPPDDVLIADTAGTYYAGRVIDDPAGHPVFLAWRQWDDAGRFLGGLSNPAPLQVSPTGALSVDARALWTNMETGGSPL